MNTRARARSRVWNYHLLQVATGDEETLYQALHAALPSVVVKVPPVRGYQSECTEMWEHSERSFKA